METLFFYDFEISKQGLLSCLNLIADDKENNKKTYGDATSFFVQMGLASLTLLENAYKGVSFNFQESSLKFVSNLCAEISSQLKSNKISQQSYVTYLQLLGAYFGWCCIKKYKGYFATLDNQKVLVINNKAYNPFLMVKMCCEENKNIETYFDNFNS